MTGSFVVGSTGNCVQSDPDAATHSAPPGEYSLAISCGACQVATFTLTRAPTLPFTGFPVGTVSLCASGLVVVGLVLCAAASSPSERKRRDGAAVTLGGFSGGV